MKIITVTKDNLDSEHICCAISNNKDCQVASKKAWLKERFEDGLVFKKGDVRGKCFIEYMPAEKAWCPIVAPDYMFINCLWVSGQLKGHGYSSLLLDECIKDSKEKGKKGLCILSSPPQKRPFLADPLYLRHKGFMVADTVLSFYELNYLPFKPDAPKPGFASSVKELRTKESGFMLYYANQCPFNAKYVPLIEAVAKEHGVILKTKRFETCEEAQNAPAPFTTYSLFYDGKLVTDEILSAAKFEKLLSEKGF